MNYFIKSTLISKLVAYLILLMLSTSIGFPSVSFAQEVHGNYFLTVEPEQCVAMRQGQICYVDVKINWRAAERGNYCLFSSLQSKAIQCWSNVNTGKLQQEMSADKNIVFSLKKQGRPNDLITKELEMAWVYKKNTRKNVSWRMF
jgi:hypothetical protein